MARIVLTIPDELAESLRADAATEGRRLNAHIRHLLAGGKPPRRKSGRKEKGSRAQIVAALREVGGGPLSTRELAARFGCHPDHLTLAWNLSDLLKEGVVTRRYRRYLGYFYTLTDR